jgi:ribosomal protein S18 acetylase RimI-like enzyme
MIAVRQASSDDVEALVVLNRSVQELHVIHQPDYFKNADPKSVADWFSSMLRNPAIRGWIAELESVPETVPIGYALTIVHDRPEHPFRFAHRFCEIDQIAVSPAFRKSGVARALIERVLEDARLQAITDVELTSWCFNSDAHEAFRALGFTQKIVRFGRKSS